LESGLFGGGAGYFDRVRVFNSRKESSTQKIIITVSEKTGIHSKPIRLICGLEKKTAE